MTPAADAVFARVRWRILPLLTVCYFISFIDRVNVGFAQLGMKEDLGITPGAYGLGAGLFFIGRLPSWRSSRSLP